jgi:hypothetical protein
MDGLTCTFDITTLKLFSWQREISEGAKKSVASYYNMKIMLYVIFLACHGTEIDKPPQGSVLVNAYFYLHCQHMTMLWSLLPTVKMLSR